MPAKGESPAAFLLQFALQCKGLTKEKLMEESKQSPKKISKGEMGS